ITRLLVKFRPRRHVDPFDADIVASVEPDGAVGIKSIRWLIRDVSHVTAVTQQLAEYQTRLRSLAAELSAAEERERRRIAVEIHDRISQTLAIARMKVAAMQQGAATKNMPLIQEVKQLLEQSL